VPVSRFIDPAPSYRLVVLAVDGKGRGVFAAEAIPAGAHLATSFGWEMTAEQLAVFTSMPAGQWNLRNFYFTHPADPSRGLLAAGLCEMVNDDPTDPNVELVWEHDPTVGWLGHLRARRAIAAGEELGMRYSDC
jgi:hypothetical protein